MNGWKLTLFWGWSCLWDEIRVVFPFGCLNHHGLSNRSPVQLQDALGILGFKKQSFFKEQKNKTWEMICNQRRHNIWIIVVFCINHFIYYQPSLHLTVNHLNVNNKTKPHATSCFSNILVIFTFSIAKITLFSIYLCLIMNEFRLKTLNPI